MDQAEKARAFAALHVKGNPLLLYNAWDAGSAKAVADAGAAAIATGSWSVASAQGYSDGEKIPLDLLGTIVRRIVASVELPVTVDVEGGYGARPEDVARTAEFIIGTGAIGINFEDQVVGGEGLHGMPEQAARIAAARKTADRTGVPLFVNARTDLFLKQRDRGSHPALLAEAKERARAYADAGGSGFFAPALVDEALIADLCEASPIPVNIMMMDGCPSPDRLAEFGVRRISYGPIPYVKAMDHLRGLAAQQLRK